MNKTRLGVSVDQLPNINISKISDSDLFLVVDHETGYSRKITLSQIADFVKSELGDIDVKLITNITYTDLRALRDASNLTPGSYYRIIDYVATTVQEHTESANHPFDIIVIADSVNKLNEVAHAIRHEGDTYFPETTKFEAWKIWYCIDNDTNRFNWADSDNGNGVIYRMIDEFDNDVPYDFKGIKMQAFLSYDGDSEVNIFSEDYRYTFGVSIDDTLQGASHTNIMKPFIDGNGQYLNGNTFGSYCYGNTFNLHCFNNTFGFSCYCNTFDLHCSYNTFDSRCFNNTFGSYCNHNTFDSRCSNNTFDSSCSNNIFDPYCIYNTFDSGCSYNTFGSFCYFNTLGLGCNENIFDLYCSYNTFGSFCYFNIFGLDCSNNTFGSECYENILSDFFAIITLQNLVCRNTINCIKDRGEYEYCRFIEIKSGVIGKEINIDDVGQSYHTEIEPNNSVTISI